MDTGSTDDDLECSGISLKEENIKQFKDTEDGIYKCLKCSDVFPSSDSLLTHYILHGKHFECGNCPVKFATYTQCLMHKRIVHTNVKFDHNCEVCGEILKLKQDLFSHYRIHALTRGTVKCDKCGMPFKNLVPLKLHELTNCTGNNSYTLLNENEGKNDVSGTGKSSQSSKSNSASSDVKEKSVKNNKFVCGSGNEDDSDDYNSSDFETVSKHQTYSCPYCSMTFYTKGLHTIHLKTHLRPHLCDICSRGFAKRYTMLCHRKTHLGIKDYTCNLCAASFTLTGQLSKHMAKHHSFDAKFVCDLCQGKFLYESTMLCHKDLCTGTDTKSDVVNDDDDDDDDDDDEQEIKMKESPERAKFTCQICSEEFTSYSVLSKHIRTHKFKYGCKFCDSKYDSKYIIISHIMVHLGIKPYRCTVCGSTFTLKAHCGRHCSIHLKQQRYTCPCCNLGFRFSPEMMRHLQLRYCKGTNAGKPKPKTLWVLDSYDEERVAAHILRLNSKNSNLSDSLNNQTDKNSNLSVSLNNRTDKNSNLSDSLSNRKDNKDTHLMSKRECDDDGKLLADDLLEKEKIDAVEVNGSDNNLNNSLESGSNVSEGFTANGGQSDREEEDESSLVAGTDSSLKNATGKRLFKCNICEKVFRRKPLLEYHNVKEHSFGLEPFKCCLCGYGAACRGQMIKHIDSHLLQKFFRCRTCQSRFASQRSLTSHVISKQCYNPDEVEFNDELETFEGSIEYITYDGVFADKGHYEESVSMEDSGTYEVKVEDLDSLDTTKSFEFSRINIKREITSCDEEDKLPSGLSISKNEESLAEVVLPQLKEEEEPEEGFVEERPVRLLVDEQPEIFSVTGNPLTIQIETDSHGTERINVNGVSLEKWKMLALDASRSQKKFKESPGWCNVCKKHILGKYKFRVHMERHGEERAYKCTVCEKNFKTAENLQRHSRWHDKTKIKTCSMCPSKFVANRDLIEHMSLHRKIKPFSCSTCGKEFRRREYLRSHMRTHTGEMPFQCKICDRRFRIHSSLHDHAKLHSGSMPYQCTVCFKRFAQRANWKTHEKRHHGFKKFECEVCHKGFVQNYELQNHRLRCVEKDLPYMCLLCEMRFTKEHPLKRHLSRHSCSICGEQFVIMKEKISHQLRCRKENKKRRHDDGAADAGEQNFNGVGVISDEEKKEHGECSWEADDDRKSGEWNSKDRFESCNDEDKDYDNSCNLIVIKTEEL